MEKSGKRKRKRTSDKKASKGQKRHRGDAEDTEDAEAKSSIVSLSFGPDRTALTLTPSQRQSLIQFRKDLRGLSVKQPSAWAIAEGYKKVENRPKRLHIGIQGRWFVLHSSAKPLGKDDGTIVRVDAVDGAILPAGVRLSDIRETAPLSMLLALVV
jgi:hypothetical protein